MCVVEFRTMGQTASHPVEAVRVMKQRGPLATAGVADMQGWRDSHEDAHFMDQPDGGLGWASFGVLDGHGGQKAALLAAVTLPLALKKATKGRKPKDGPGIGKLQAAFEEVDADLKKNMGDGSEPSGSTSISAGVKIQPDGRYSCYLANAGDSRGILVRLRGADSEANNEHVSTSVNTTLVLKKVNKDDGAEEFKPEDAAEKGTPVEEAAKILEVLRIGSKEFEFLASIDNKPDRLDERKRIEDAGGSVAGDDCPRVDGNLAVSRGFADFTYKSSAERPPSQQKVSCVPELYEMRDMEKGDLIILACDGIFDVLSNEEVVRNVVHRLSAASPDVTCDDVLGKTCSDILSVCMQKGSTDNMTCMIVQVGDLDYVKLGQEPPAEPKVVKKATVDQELSLPSQETLKKHLEDASVKKSYIAFLEMCIKDGCDISHVPNVDMIIDAKEKEERSAVSNSGASMTQKERLQKKLEERKKANPPPPEKPAAKVPATPAKEDVKNVAPEKEASGVVSSSAQGTEVSEGGGKKKGKKVQPGLPDAASSDDTTKSAIPPSPVATVAVDAEATLTANDDGDLEGPGQGQKKKNKSKNKKK